MNARSLALLVIAAPLASVAAQTTASRAPDFKWEKSLAAGSLVHLNNLNGDRPRAARSKSPA
jgi:hypothetical protein